MEGAARSPLSSPLRQVGGTGVRSSRSASRDATTGLRESKPALRDGTAGLRESKPALRESRSGLRDHIRSARTTADSRVSLAGQERVVGTELRDRTVLSSRLSKYSGRTTTTRPFGSPLRNDPVSRLRRPHVVYHDRPHQIQHTPRHVYTYYDRHHRMCHRIIWPRYHYPVYYSWGPHATFGCVYPYYHRKYVFVSLGGYWPFGYSYLRYYWYGYHPYAWYGYYPVPREASYDTQNYYTYNYYTGEQPATYTEQPVPGDMQERLQQQQGQPAEQTLADTRFEEGVKSFESGDYTTAAAKFATAIKLAPDDVILPFAHAQALFADRQYSAAAQVLRDAFKSMSPEKEGIFYPRGLYPDDDVLFAQIERLLDKLEQFGYDGDLQLLLGYHLLGIGETEYARRPLELASRDIQNAEAARTMLSLLEKMEADVTAGSQGGAAPNTQVGATDSPQTTAGATAAPAGQGKAEVLRRLAEDEKPAGQEGPARSAPQEASPSGAPEKSLLTEPKKSPGTQSLTDPLKGTQGANDSDVISAPGGAGAGVAIGAKEPPANKEDDDGNAAASNSAVRSPGK
ncbi:MAG: hypothetical protein JW741_26580 [Sedimentisphaerales bacterium]|nr:hypothetical protein [Sedimentisphaerales bacterium]